MQPIRNRFLRSADEQEYTHSLAIGCCQACGTVQLHQPMPAAEVPPRFDWITYNEPESHLNQLADDISQLPGLSPMSSVVGISYKDESTLRRLRERGLSRTWVADLREDLGITNPGTGIESIQQHLTPQTADTLVSGTAAPTLWSSPRPGALPRPSSRSQGAAALTAPGGYLVFEVPDAGRALERLDYSTVWEEHVFYFTPATLRNCLALTGFDLVSFRSFPYTLEDSLVAIVRSSSGPPALQLSADGWKPRRAGPGILSGSSRLSAIAIGVSSRTTAATTARSPSWARPSELAS